MECLLAIVLGLIGLLLVYFEFFVPGGILGALGALFLITGLVVNFWKQISPTWSLVYAALLIAFLVLTIRLAIWKIKKTDRVNHFYLAKDQEGYRASSYDKELIGEIGVALSPLKPSGHILIRDRPYQAVSESGYVQKGSKIEIISGEGSRLVVRKVES